VEEGDSEGANVKSGFAILLIIGLSACVLTPKQQFIDADVNHWTHYAISEGIATVTLKIPPGYRTLKMSLPEPYNGSHERLILEAHMTTARRAPTIWPSL